MTKVLETCSSCQGIGTVPHFRQPLQEGEVRDPVDLETFKTIDICLSCGGSGKRVVVVSVSE